MRPGSPAGVGGPWEGGTGGAAGGEWDTPGPILPLSHLWAQEGRGRVGVLPRVGAEPWAGARPG